MDKRKQKVKEMVFLALQLSEEIPGLQINVNTECFLVHVYNFICCEDAVYDINIEGRYSKKYQAKDPRSIENGIKKLKIKLTL